MAAATRNRLWEAAQREANRLGRSFDPAAESRLKNLIDEGVKNMESLGVENNEHRIQEAEDNVSEFVRAMNNDAQRRGKNVLDLDSYNAALGICPAFPIC